MRSGMRISSYILENIRVKMILVEEMFKSGGCKNTQYIAREDKFDSAKQKIFEQIEGCDDLEITYEAKKLLGLNKGSIVSCDNAKQCYKVIRHVDRSRNNQGWKKLHVEKGLRIYQFQKKKKALRKNTNKDRYDVYTDGSWDISRRDGGWAFVILKNGRLINKGSGYVKDTTSNRMELKAAAEALKAVSIRGHITIHSDSRYLVNTMRKKYRKGCNHDLWNEIQKAASKRKVDWKWIRGHDGNTWNEMVDMMAKQARIKGRKETLDFYIDSKHGRKQYSVYKGGKLIEKVNRKVYDGQISIEKTTDIIIETLVEVLTKIKEYHNVVNITIHTSNLAIRRFVKNNTYPDDRNIWNYLRDGKVKIDFTDYGTILSKVKC